MNTFPLHKTTQLYCRFRNLLDKVYSPPFNLHPEKIWVNFMGYILQGTLQIFHRVQIKRRNNYSMGNSKKKETKIFGGNGMIYSLRSNYNDLVTYITMIFGMTLLVSINYKIYTEMIHFDFLASNSRG